MQDLSDHPFSPENIAYESGEDTESDRRWYAFVARVERLLDITSLDGTDSEEGYSLDSAFEWWESNKTPDSYADEVRRKNRLRKDIDDMKARFAAGEFNRRK